MSDAQKPRRRLGRGLDSLISLSETALPAGSDNPAPAETADQAGPNPSPIPAAGASPTGIGPVTPPVGQPVTVVNPSESLTYRSAEAIDLPASPAVADNPAAGSVIRLAAVVTGPDVSHPSAILSAMPSDIQPDITDKTAAPSASPSATPAINQPGQPVVSDKTANGRPLSDTPATNESTQPAGQQITLAGQMVIRLTQLPLDQVSINPYQPRRVMNQERLSELAANIKSSGGLIQPIVVTPKPDGGYQLIAGERRWRASRLAGLEIVPCIVRPVDQLRQAELALSENIHREDLNPIDRATAYQSIMKQQALTQVQLAERLGEDRSSIANYLRLLDLTAPARDLVRDGQLSLGHAKLLAGVVDPMVQTFYAQTCVREGLSIRQLHQLVNKPAPEKSKPLAPARPAVSTAHIAELEKNVSRQIGMRAQIRPGKGGKGKLVLHYGTLDQFDQLLDRLNIRVED